MKNSSVYGITLSKNKAIKAFLMLIVAVTVILGTSGCGSSLTDDEVFDKVEELAPQYRSFYKGIKCRFIVNHLRLLWQITCIDPSANAVVEIRRQIGSCDEFWTVEVEYGPRSARTDRLVLCRRGSHFYIVKPKPQ